MTDDELGYHGRVEFIEKTIRKHGIVLKNYRGESIIKAIEIYALTIGEVNIIFKILHSYDGESLSPLNS